MKIHEFQAKDLLRAAGVPVLVGKVARTPDEAAAAFPALGTPVCAVKAQIHAGGRGKGGGVKVVKNIDDARAAAEKILGMMLVTHQTGPQGQKVHKLFIEQGCAIARELYLGAVVDRALAHGWSSATAPRRAWL